MFRANFTIPAFTLSVSTFFALLHRFETRHHTLFVALRIPLRGTAVHDLNFVFRDHAGARFLQQRQHGFEVCFVGREDSDLRVGWQAMHQRRQYTEAAHEHGFARKLPDLLLEIIEEAAVARDRANLFLLVERLDHFVQPHPHLGRQLPGLAHIECQSLDRAVDHEVREALRVVHVAHTTRIVIVEPDDAQRRGGVRHLVVPQLVTQRGIHLEVLHRPRLALGHGAPANVLTCLRSLTALLGEIE